MDRTTRRVGKKSLMESKEENNEKRGRVDFNTGKGEETTTNELSRE